MNANSIAARFDLITLSINNGRLIEARNELGALKKDVVTAIPMDKATALVAIKTLRDQINDVPGDPTEWQNEVCSYMDQASDVLEFPK